MTLPFALMGTSGAAAAARAAFGQATAGNCLLVAETGLEPESLARYLHDRTRPGTPLVDVNCAGQAPDALEAALLGVRARTPSAGLDSIGPKAAILEAGAGTVLLRNVGELPAAVQQRLARVLRDGEATRQGSRARVRIAARLVGWSPAALDADVRSGRFRADLLRRLGPTLTVPALRTRAEDVPVIADALLEALCDAAGRPKPALTKAAKTVLSAVPWADNVDEMRAMLRRLLQRQPGALIQQEDVLEAFRAGGLAARMRAHVSLREARRRFEREYIADVLEQSQWRMSDAARVLGIERANLYRKTRQLGIARVPGGRR